MDVPSWHGRLGRLGLRGALYEFARALCARRHAPALGGLCSVWAIFATLAWRYASVDELGQIALAVTTATVLVTLAFFGILKPFGLLHPDFPRSIPFTEVTFGH
ncbi:MAG: hypothetical protein HY782_25720 [Chloroflexi bacterium]|nr:hypothetical protein [Chloroflexota bacterium]